METEEAVLMMERCQSRECPLTGIDNCNHAVRPGCKNYGVPIKINLSFSETGQYSAACQTNRINAVSRGGGMARVGFLESDDRKLSPKPQNDFRHSDGIPVLSAVDQSKMRCCNCHSNGRAKCASTKSSCPCRKAGKKCIDCFPSSKGKCLNCPSLPVVKHTDGAKSNIIGFHGSGVSISPKTRKYEEVLEMKPELGLKNQLDEVQKVSSRVENARIFIEDRDNARKSSNEASSDRSVDISCDGDLKLRQEFPFADKMMLQAFGETLTNSTGSPMVGRTEKIWERAASLKGKLYRLPGGAVGREFTSISAEEYE